MATGLKFQTTIHTITADFGDHFFEAAVLTFVGTKNFDFPATRLRVTAVHAEQVTSKNCRFITTSTGAHFNKRVTLVIRVFWQQQHLQLLF